MDAQLPPALARWLAHQDHEADHVADLGLEAATDQVIWERAAAGGAVIVTKDEDFARRRVLAPGGPPVVWLRIGNTRRAELLRWFPGVLPQILIAIARGESLIELRLS